MDKTWGDTQVDNDAMSEAGSQTAANLDAITTKKRNLTSRMQAEVEYLMTIKHSMMKSMQ